MKHPQHPFQQRQKNFDVLRVLACFAVIVVHSATGVIFNAPTLDNQNWWVAAFYDASMRWCVPIFIMLTGALLIPKAAELSIFMFWRSRLQRIIFPTLFWSSFYVLVSIAIVGNLENVGLLMAMMGNKPFFHLWYFYLAILLYCAVPIVSRTVARLSKRQTILFIALSFVVTTITNWPSFEGQLTIFSIFAYLSYLATGYLAATASKTSPRMNCLYLAIFALCWLTLVGCSALLLSRFGYSGWEYMFSFSNILVAIMSYCIFQLAINLPINFSVAPLAKLTLGIYAIHPLWFMTLSEFGITSFSFGPSLGIPLMSIVVFALSICTAFILSRFKFLSAVVV